MHLPPCPLSVQQTGKQIIHSARVAVVVVVRVVVRVVVHVVVRVVVPGVFDI